MQKSNFAWTPTCNRKQETTSEVPNRLALGAVEVLARVIASRAPTGGEKKGRKARSSNSPVEPGGRQPRGQRSLRPARTLYFVGANQRVFGLHADRFFPSPSTRIQWKNWYFTSATSQDRPHRMIQKAYRRSYDEGTAEKPRPHKIPETFCNLNEIGFSLLKYCIPAKTGSFDSTNFVVLDL